MEKQGLFNKKGGILLSLINIGFLRRKSTINSFMAGPNDYNNALFYIGAHYGVRWVMFTPDDIDFKANMVHGIILKNGKVEKCTVEIPVLIDYYAYNYVPVAKLKSGGMFLFRPSCNLSKSRIDNLLTNDGKFSDILIPTKKVEKFEDIIQGIDNYNQVIVKPTIGHSGQGIRSISRFEDKYRITYKKKHFYFTHDKLRDNWYLKRISIKGYMIQPYITSSTKNGEAVSCACVVQERCWW